MTILIKTNKAGCFMLIDLKLYYKATEIKTISIDIKTERDEQNRRENSKINPYINDQLIFEKGGKTIMQKGYSPE